MKTTIKAVKFDVKQPLESHMEKKVQKIEKFYDKLTEVQVYLKVDAPEKSNNKIVELKAIAPHTDFFASKKCDTFEQAIDLTVEAIEKQIIKHKEKSVQK